MAYHGLPAGVDMNRLYLEGNLKVNGREFEFMVGYTDEQGNRAASIWPKGKGYQTPDAIGGFDEDELAIMSSLDEMVDKLYGLASEYTPPNTGGA